MIRLDDTLTPASLIPSIDAMWSLSAAKIRALDRLQPGNGAPVFTVDGRYTARVVASDAPSNSTATALTGDLESTAFDIDNTPPVITVTNVRREGGRATIAFEVRDENSAVQKVEYSLDGDRWQAAYPKDGIADSRVEQYELAVPEAQSALGVVLRATDALNNVSSARGVASSSGR